MPIPDNTAASVIAAGSSTSATITVNPSCAKRPAMALPIPLAARRKDKAVMCWKRKDRAFAVFYCLVEFGYTKFGSVNYYHRSKYTGASAPSAAATCTPRTCSAVLGVRGSHLIA
jgi:hypothetical protein